MAHPLPPVSAAWLAPGVLPTVEPSDSWAWCQGGGVLPRSLEGLEQEVLLDPDREAPKAKGFVLSRPVAGHVVLVARPQEAETLPAYEVPELAPALLRRDLQMYEYVMQKKAVLILLTGALTAAALIFNAPAGLLFWPVIWFVDVTAPYIDASLETRSLRRNPNQYLEGKAHEVRFQVWLQHGSHARPYRSWGMAACWALLFVMQMVVGMDQSVAAAALVKPRVWSEPWRLLTGPMLHGSPMHLLMNGFAMLGLGQLLERSSNRHLVVPVWLAGALGGALASSILLPGKSSVGASGGLMAMVGFLAVMGWRRRALLPPGFGKSMARSMLYIGMLGLLAWKIIDNAGHGGGLVAGALLGLAIFPKEPSPLPLEDTPALAISGWASTAIFLATAAFTGFKLLQA